MAIVHRSGYCTHCQAQRPYRLNAECVHHVGYLLMFVVLLLVYWPLGILWLMVWAARTIMATPMGTAADYVCQTCGNTLQVDARWAVPDAMRDPTMPTPVRVIGSDIPADWQPPRKEPWSQPLR